MKIVLVAIVKNEEQALPAMLESVRGIVDEYVVVDTGSTDSTKEIIAGYGPVYESPFVDFVTTKNVALDLAASKGDYVLFMDADERVEVGLHLLKQHAEAGVDVANALIIEGVSEVTQRYYRPRLWRNDGRWRFHGPGVHEYVAPTGEVSEAQEVGIALADSGILVRHDHRHRSPESYAPRNQMYVDILEKALTSGPEDTRALFYLARTLKDMGEWLRAIDVYRRYLALDASFLDEKWQSAYDIAFCYKQMGEYEAAHAAVRRAVEIDPRRAEANVLMAEMYSAMHEWARVEDACRAALEIPLPNNVVLFQNPQAHTALPLDYLAIALDKQGRYREALAACEQLAAYKGLDRRVISNLAWLRGATHRTIFFTLGHTPEPVWGDMIGEVGVGGVETTYVELPKLLAARGHSVFVFCRTEKAHLSDGVYFLPWGDLGDYADLRPDVLVTSRWFEPLHREVFRDAMKIIWLQDAHFADPDWPGTYEVADKVICSSRWHRAYIGQRLGWMLDMRKVHIVPLGIRKAMFENLAPGGKTKGRVVYSSNPDRGLAILAAAWPELCRQRPDLSLRITYGWEGLRTWGESAEWQAHCDNTEAQIRGMFAGYDNVTFTGRLKKAELYEELAQAEVCLYPNNFQETFCLTALECQAAGTPMVTTAMGALMTTLNHEYNVLIAGNPDVRGGYVDAFVGESLALLGDEERLEKYAQGCARSVAESALDWADIAGLWETHLYRR